MEKSVPYVSVEGITKTFGKVVANRNINLTIYGGEVHALLGENGAGKSTLMNMLSGIYNPDSGFIYVHGNKQRFTSPKSAIDCGIGMIHQHFKLVEAMTAEENILLGQKTGFFLNHKQAMVKINDICERFGLNVHMDKKVHEMSVGEKQNLEILKVMYRGANILILDEPTTVFTPQETKNLFKIIRKMKDEGCAIIFISHKMDEVMEIADKITVLRKGETVKTLLKKETNPKELAELMVGHPVDLSIQRIPAKWNEHILQINELKVDNNEGAEVIKGMNFYVRKGEILGIAGIANSGQKELCEAIVGMQTVKSGEIIFEEENLVGKTTEQILKKGISMSFVPEDRLGMGLVASMDMVDNFLLKSYHGQKGMFIDRKEPAVKAEKIVKELDIQTPSINHAIKDLSGGNIQKVLVGRELDCEPKLLIMAYPSRGLDINTCCTIYELMNKQKQKGVGIMFIGEDLDVLMQLCDRIVVICAGNVTGVVDADKVTKEELGLMMVGHKLDKKEEASLG